MPSVLMLLLGGVMIPILPVEAQAGTVLLAVFGVAGTLYSAWMGGGGRR